MNQYTHGRAIFKYIRIFANCTYSISVKCPILVDYKLPKNIQSTLVISTSLFSNNGLSQSENLVSI